MRYIADFHIHSRFSRATSKSLDFPNIDKWCRIKGIDVVTTGDMTHPQWRREMAEFLESAEDGLFALKKEKRIVDAVVHNKQDREVRFILGTELSCIYKHNDRVYRNHILVLLPTLVALDAFIASLEKRGVNLRADGRPIMGLRSREVTALALQADERALVIPAHIWTPWFSMFGSKSGAHSLEESFEDMAPHIYALETGLSSNPPMNWHVSGLDRLTILSNSDAHSPQKLGREANVFDLSKLNYNEIFDTIKENDAKRLKYTIEFFPEEGKYHLDGHRNCGVVLEPKATAKHKGKCPKCGRALTIGVLNRVEEFADCAEQDAAGRIPFKSIVPLTEIIANAYGVGASAKKVDAAFVSLVGAFESEFAILLDAPYDALAKTTEPIIVEGIRRVREERVEKHGGYDGVFGTIEIFSDAEREGRKQGELFTL